MSDLQCPANVLLAPHATTHGDGTLSEAGEDQARQLGRSLAAERVAVVYAGTAPPAVHTAEVVAGVVGAAVRLVEELGEAGVAGELEALADLHRGETVLVVSHAAAVERAVAHLTGGSPARRTPGGGLGPCEVVALAADADGWVLR